MMAGTSYQPRYFVSEAGILTYYAKEADVSSKKGPKKGWRINLRYYGVNSLPGDPTRFCLVPTPDAFTAYTHAAGDGMPPPDRVFEIEAENSGAKGNWVEALKGKSSSGEKDAEIARDTTEETEATKVRDGCLKCAHGMTPSCSHPPPFYPVPPSLHAGCPEAGSACSRGSWRVQGRLQGSAAQG